MKLPFSIRDDKLTNRFHDAECLFSNTGRSQMTSKQGKNKTVIYEPFGECVSDVLSTF